MMWISRDYAMVVWAMFFDCCYTLMVNNDWKMLNSVIRSAMDIDGICHSYYYCLWFNSYKDNGKHKSISSLNLFVFSKIIITN